MIIDITDRIRNAMLVRRTTDETSKLLERLSTFVNGSKLDWEQGVEFWARVLVRDNVVAIVHTEVPLVIITKSAAEQLDSCPGAWLIIDDFDKHNIRANRDVLELLAKHPISANVDTDCMSVNDLWWATVT